MPRFIEGEPRTQSTLFPERLEDYIDEDNSVRAIEAFVDALDLEDLGFDGINPKETGRPAYHPALMLKLYIYGYLKKIQSSRRLEKESNRNLELMWLLNRLSPDLKTIADFRRDNAQGIKPCCRQFVMLCKQLNLFAHALIAIDGSWFKAVNNRDRNYTQAKVKILYWERNGFCLWQKQLEQDRFHWPQPKAGHILLTGEHLNWLLDGYNIALMQPHPERLYEVII